MSPPLNHRHITEKELLNTSPFKLKYIHTEQVKIPPSKKELSYTQLLLKINHVLMLFSIGFHSPNAR